MDKLMRSFNEIAATYAPYHTMPAFQEGAEAYAKGRYDNPFQGVAAQAWDRGLEAAMRFARPIPKTS
jgi:hypothetical protein